MKKLVLAIAVVASVVALVAWIPGSEADAANCYRCMHGGTTPTVWGFGATCASATNDAVNQALSQAPSSCDLCGNIAVNSVPPCGTDCSNTSTCYTPYGEWRVDLNVTYRCNVDFCM